MKSSFKYYFSLLFQSTISVYYFSLRLWSGSGLSDCLWGFLHRPSVLILAKEKQESPFQDFLLGNVVVRVMIIGVLISSINWDLFINSF